MSSALQELVAAIRNVLGQLPVAQLQAHHAHGERAVQRLRQITAGSTHDRPAAAVAARSTGNASLTRRSCCCSRLR